MIAKSKVKALKEMLQVLGAGKIMYAIAGPLASYIWGVKREVRDIYIIIEKADFPFLIEACRSKGIEVKLADKVIGLSNMELAVAKFINQNSIESLIIIARSKIMPSDILRRAVYTEIKSMGKFYVVSPEDTIILKLMNKTPIDVRDAKLIYKYLYKRLDLKYLKKICKDYNIRCEKYISLKKDRFILENLRRD